MEPKINITLFNKSPITIFSKNTTNFLGNTTTKVLTPVTCIEIKIYITSMN